MLSRISKFLENPHFGGIVFSIITLLIEYHSGLFVSTPGSPSLFPSPAWLVVLAFTSTALLISTANFLRVSINSHQYFREDFSRKFIETFSWLSLAFLFSILGKLMVWYPFWAVAYLVAGQKPPANQTSPEGYFLLVVLQLLLYNVASNQHQKWDGRQSVQQHQRRQRSEDVGIFKEGIEDFKRIFSREKDLDEYRESTDSSLITPLEQSEDFISQAWKDQALELLRLSSSSYVFDEESVWHDKRKCWEGKDVNTEKLIFLFPANTAFDKVSLDSCVNYSREIAESRKVEIDELIIAFRNDIDKFHTPKGFHDFIRFVSRDEFIERLINFTDYFNDIQRRVRMNHLPESDFTLNDVYIPSELLSSDGEHLSNNIEDFLNSWLDEPDQRQIALLGEYGQGKSSAALMFTHHIICKIKDKLPKRIPILVELRGKSPRDLQPLELLGAWASKYRIDPQALMRLHISGRLVLIFEGFDEMALIGNSELRLRHFRALWKFCYPEAKIMITGRPNFFLDDNEMKTALGIIKPVSDRPYCQAVRLAPFNTQQIREALRVHNVVIQEQICTLAEREPRFLELVSRPSLLHVVAILWEKEALYEKTDLLNSAYVMDCFVRSSYRRQGLKAQDARDFMALNSSERDYFMCGIATYMAAKKLGNQIPNETLNELIDNLIEEIPDSVSTSSSEILGEDTKPLHKRIKEPKEDIEHIKTDVRTCGLLVDDPCAPGTFKFGHKSFMEFLFSVVVKEYIWDSNPEKARAIRKNTDFPLEAILDLPVSIGFLAEMIGTDSSTRFNVSKSSADRNERSIASKLLRVIFEAKENSISWFFTRCLIFNTSFYHSQVNLRTFRLVLSAITMTLVITLLFLVYTVHFDGSILKPLNLLVFTLFIIITGGYFYILGSIISGSGDSINSRLQLWSSICKDLEISNTVLHQIVWISFLPWTKGKTFDYF